MAKTTAPLMSFEATGQLGQSLVFSSWKGRKYARRYTVPSNPRTAAQTTVRNTFQWLNQVWPFLPAAAIEAWKQYATNSRFTNRNGWTKINQPLLRQETDISNIQLTISAGGGLAAGGAVISAASQGATITLLEPTLPSGWQIVAAHGLAMQQTNPQDGAIPNIGYATDASAPYEPNITNLEPTTEYVVQAWFEYLKPDGNPAYGTPETAIITTLA